MSTASKPSNPLRAVGLALLLVLSVVGGATAVAGGTDTDGSLTESVDETLTATPDGDTTDLDDSDGDSTSDDGSTSDGGTDSTTDDTDDSTTSDTVDDTTTTDGDTTDSETDETLTDATGTTSDGVTDGAVLDSSRPDTISTGRLDTNIVGVAGVFSLTGPSTTAQQSSSGDDGSGAGAEPGASPDSVGITAGAANQSAIAVEDGGPATFDFTESAAGAFPANGTARLSLPEDSGVAVDTDATDAVVTVDNGTAAVTDVSSSTVTVAVMGTDPNGTTTIHLSGLRFESQGDATAVDATWSYGTQTAATTVEPERLGVSGIAATVPRGAHGVPEDGTIVRVQANDARSEGFIREGGLFVLTIPVDLQDEIAFDASSTPTARTESGDCSFPIISDPRQEQVRMADQQIRIELSCEVGTDEYLEIRGIRFNVSGADAETPAELTGQLTASYQPVDQIDAPTVDAGDPISAHAPVLSAGGTTVPANATNVTGDGNVTVSIADDVGGLMADGSHVTVDLQDTGVTFNESQSLEAVTVSGDADAPTVVSANGSTVVLELQSTTTADDEFRLQRAGGGGIRFDVGANASDAALSVTTTPGAEAVTQTTGTVVTVGQRHCRSVAHAIAGEDDRISNPEIAQAVDHWQQGTEVPGTCGATISNPQIAQLKDVWRTGGTVDES